MAVGTAFTLAGSFVRVRQAATSLTPNVEAP